jgi:hypothetical protein
MGRRSFATPSIAKAALGIVLERFPGALFDAHGYVRFENKSALLNCPGILIGEAKNWVNFAAGIASLPDYVRVL